MVSKKRSVIIAAIVGLFCFLSVVYVSSCSKLGIPVSCDGIVCNNGGFCLVDSIAPHRDSAECVCPLGFEGTNCATASVTKYLGTWNVLQTVIGSDSVKAVGTQTTYAVTLEASGTPTTFMIYNLCGDQNYNDVVCTIDSLNTAANLSSNNFVIDSQSAFHMIFDHFKLTQNSTGTINPAVSIKTVLYTKHLDNNVNWVHDTLNILMTPN